MKSLQEMDEKYLKREYISIEEHLDNLEVNYNPIIVNSLNKYFNTKIYSLKLTDFKKDNLFYNRFLIMPSSFKNTKKIIERFTNESSFYTKKNTIK